ncbi:MAG: sulfite exporter TauE/SafE family protein [Chitinophagales bacterium]
MEFLWAAISLGFLGSFHCVGMCGPIAMALPLNQGSQTAKVLGTLAYNLGRIVTYGVFGLIFGLLGKGFILAGFQQGLSIALGVILLVLLLFPQKYAANFGLTKIMSGLVMKIKSSLGHFIREKGYLALFTVGMLNGLLPCGLVYLGVAGAIATGSAPKGAAFMMMFGAGTLPAMALVNLASNSISLGVRNKIRKVVPVFVGLMACVLIMRGMNLGIPYLSPQLSKTDCTKHSCCHKK